MRPIGVGGVEEVQAAIQRVVQGGDGFAVVALALEIAHAHAAQADGGNARAIAAECACLHGVHFFGARKV
jgi:hypothetical protein